LRQTVKIAVDVGLRNGGQGSPEAGAILMMIDIHQRHLNFIWSQPRRQILTIIVSVIVPAHG
jgi:hypothetical protein